MEWAEERVGDYLGPKIPSLMEFLENRIHLREVMGVSMHEGSGSGPTHRTSLGEVGPTLERQVINDLLVKDQYHDNIVFKSEE